MQNGFNTTRVVRLVHVFDPLFHLLVRAVVQVSCASHHALHLLLTTWQWSIAMFVPNFTLILKDVRYVSSRIPSLSSNMEIIY